MSPPMSEDQPPRNDDEPRGKRAVKTFIYEVTAGQPKGVGDASRGCSARFDPGVLAPAAVEPAAVEPAIVENESDDDSLDASKGAERAAVLTLDGPLPVVERKGRRARSAPKVSSRPAVNAAEPVAAARPRRISAWSASAVVHVLFFAAAALIIIPPRVQRDMLEFVMAPPPLEEFDLAEVVPEDESALDTNSDASAEAGLESISGGDPAAVVDPGLPTLGMEAGAGALSDITSEIALVSAGGGASDGPPGGRGGSGGGSGNGTGGSAGFGTGLGGSPTAEFFGTKIDGNRIVFVLDNSGSMQQGRLETVIAELLRSVDSLTPKQSFYVVFYSDQAYPLFYPDPAQDFVRPTERAKAELARWLDTVELCLGDAVQEALAGAISIEPDCVILLSDGRIQGEKKMRFLLEAGGGDFPIHTVGVGLGKTAVASRRNLQMIAEANGGEFREASVPEEMRELALTKPRPYHNQTPGPVWGRNVKGWGAR
jgi:hypothetical protein